MSLSTFLCSETFSSSGYISSSTSTPSRPSSHRSRVIPFKSRPGRLSDDGVQAYICAHARASQTILTFPATPCVEPPLMIGVQARWRRSGGTFPSCASGMSRNSRVRSSGDLFDMKPFARRQFSWHQCLQSKRGQKRMGSPSSGL